MDLLRTTLLATAPLLSWGCSAQPGLDRPNYVRAEAAGTLLVSDLLHQRIVRMSPEGELLDAFASGGIGEGKLWKIRGLVSLDDGSFAVINHRPDSEAELQEDTVQELKIFDARGREQRAFSLQPPGETSGWTEGVTRIPGGFAVTDSGTSQVLLFDDEGAVTGRIDAVRGGPALENPQGVRWDGDCLWLVEYQAHRVRCLGLDGTELARFGTEGRGAGELLFPMSVVPNRSEGWVAVADMGNHRVQRFGIDGDYLGELVISGVDEGVPAQVLDVELDAVGRLLVADSKGDRVVRVDRQSGDSVDLSGR